MSMASGLGMGVSVGDGPAHARLFGEDQARYVIALKAGDVEAVKAAAKVQGVPVRRLGTVGGERFIVEGLIDRPVADLTLAHESWFPAFMSGEIVEPAAAA